MFFLCVAGISFETCRLTSLSMRYSRMLEESSFANRRADYFWLLLLCAILLLVRPPVCCVPFFLTRR
jgi:Derlin-2/3